MVCFAVSAGEPNGGKKVTQSCPYHVFDVSFQEAKRIQCELRKLVNLQCSHISPRSLERVGGVDVAFLSRFPESSPKTRGIGENDVRPGKKLQQEKSNRNPESIAIAGVVVIDVKRRIVVEKAYATAPVLFPYVPGFLSFREGPSVLKAIGELSELPGVMIYDGCGIAHPRGLGLASHMSLMTGIPSIGCAKSRLCGVCEEPSASKGSWSEVVYDDVVVGACLRTRDKVKPVFVSPGNSIGIDNAREIVEYLATRFRLPEPTRLAHHFVTALKKELTYAHLA